MAGRQDELRRRLMATFRLEAEEHLQAISTGLLALEKGMPEREAAEVIETVFRAVHTLKGAARSVALSDVEARCQELESVLSRLKGGRMAPTHEVVRSLQQEARAVASKVADLDAPPPAGAVKVPATPSSPAAALARGQAAPAADTGPPMARTGTVRIDASRLDALQARAEDLRAAKLALDARVEAARSLTQALTGKAGALQAAAPDKQARSLFDGLLHDQRVVSSAVEGLQDEMLRLRMMPASSVLDAFPAMVADLARASGKAVEWSVSGAGLEIDRKVLDALREPLLHVVRNAVDHGIEGPEVRTAAAKAPDGRISVEIVPLEGRRIEVRIEDDGAGIDPAHVRAAAVRARVIGAEDADALSDEAALDLVFASGVSTTPVVTDLSGHGLGMAIVRDRVERLGGRVVLDSRPGLGTTVSMLLPATVATFRGLLVRAAHPVLLPLASVERALRVTASEVQSAAGRPAIRYDGHALPVADLTRVLGWAVEEAKPQGNRLCVVIRTGDERAGFFVDDVLGEREVLVKELAPPLVRVRHVASGGLLGTGELALILRPEDLIRGAAEPLAAGSSVASKGPAAILVVDDSITTRTMERNLLEAAGYRVEVAADGIEAWTALRSGHFDLVVSDVDMPRLNGFDLTSRIRSDSRLSDLPVVLVTALESREEKERGIEAGANAYVIKSGFDQSKLLELIERLI